MALITVRELRKTYRVAVRKSGVAEAFKGLFHREYRDIRALDGVHFTLEPGELVGYIGPNGAGKSTTVKILSGILRPDSGEVDVDGRVPWKQRVQHVSHIGVVFGQRSQLWWDVPVIDSFELLRDIYRVPQAQYQKNRDELVERLNLTGFLETPVRQLSLGQRMRCELAASLLHTPAILFLDEPTIGLDAVSKLAVRDFIKERNRELGTTVILTTHDMDDIDALCERVCVIGRGQLLYDGAMDALKQKYSGKRQLSVSFTQPVTLDIAGVEIQGDSLNATILFDPETMPVAGLVSRLSAHYPIKDFVVEHVPIESVIARMYEDMSL